MKSWARIMYRKLNGFRLFLLELKCHQGPIFANVYAFFAVFGHLDCSGHEASRKEGVGSRNWSKITVKKNTIEFRHFFSQEFFFSIKVHLQYFLSTPRANLVGDRPSPPAPRPHSLGHGSRQGHTDHLTFARC